MHFRSRADVRSPRERASAAAPLNDPSRLAGSQVDPQLPWRRHSRTPLLAAVCLAALTHGQAAVITWNNPAGGSWFSPTNWSPAQLPGPTDTVILGGSGSYIVTFVGTATVGGLTLGAPGGTKTLRLDAGTLTLNGPGSVTTDGAWRQLGGGLAGSGDLLIDGSWQWSAGIVQRTGEIVLGANAHGLWDTIGTKLFGAGTVRNRGQVTWSAGLLNSTGAATLINEANGVMEWQGALTWSGTLGRLLNGGMLRKTGAGALNCNAAWTNLASGTVSIDAGTIYWRGGGAGAGVVNTGVGAVMTFSSGTFDFSGLQVNGSMQVSGPTVVLNTGSSLRPTSSVSVGAGTLRLSSGTTHEPDTFEVTGGGVDSSDTLRVITRGHWGGGIYQGTGTWINETLLIIDGAATKQFLGGTLRNRGSIVWTAGGMTSSAAAATLINELGATIECSSSVGWAGAPGFLDNAGTWRHVGLVTLNNGVRWTNRPSGTITVDQGTANWTAGGSGGGTFSAAAGAMLGFLGGTFNLDGAVLTGGGTNRIGGGTVVLRNGSRLQRPVVLALAAGNLQLVSGAIHEVSSILLSGGSWVGSDTLRSGAASVWTGGTFQSTGEWINEISLELSGVGTKLFGGGVLRNQGTLTWTTGAVGGGANIARLVNEAGAIVEFNGSSAWTGPQTSIENYGTLRKTGGSAVNYLVQWNNHPGATVSVDGGTVFWRNGGTIGGTVNVASGATLAFGSGTFNLLNSTWTGPGTNETVGAVVNGGAGTRLSGAGVVWLAAGTLRLATGVPQSISALRLVSGTLELLDTVAVTTQGEWSGGILQGVGTLRNDGTLLINAAPTKTFAGGTLRNRGLLRWTQGAITGSSAALLVNEPGATVSVEGAFTWAGAGRWENSGVVRKLTAATRATLFADFANLGSLEILEGSWQENGSWTQSGGRTLLTGTTLTCAGTTAAQVTGGVLQGDGSITALSLTAGTNAPGDGSTNGPIGTLQFSPGTQFGPSAVSEFDLGGPRPGIDHDQIVVENILNTNIGPVTVAGLLRARLIHGYDPPAGTRLTVLHAHQRNGQFSNTDLPPGFTIEYTATDVVLRRDFVPATNRPPAIAAVAAQTILAGQSWSLPLSATDPDVPPQSLQWSILASPSGVTVDPSSGVLSWRPAPAIAPGDFTIAVQVTDSGTPALTDTRTIAVHVNAAPPSPLIESIASVQVLNGDLYLIDADGADADPTTQRNILRAQALVDFASPDLLGHSAVYRVEFRLVNTHGGSVPLHLPAGTIADVMAVDLSETLTRPRTPLGTDLISREQLSFSADLNPAARLEADEQYRVEASLHWRLPGGSVFTATGDTGQSPYQRVLHFTNSQSGDVALNAITEATAAQITRTYAVATIPGRQTFRVQVPLRMYRYDEFQLPPSAAPITVTLRGRLVDASTGQEIALRTDSTTVTVNALSHDANVPAGPAITDVSVTLELEPAPGATVDILAGHYVAEISSSHLDVPGDSGSQRRGVPAASPAQPLLRFDGRLLFGTVATTFVSIANNPSIVGVVPGSSVRTFLAVDNQGGYVTLQPTDRYGDGTPLPVLLFPDGHAEIESGQVTLTGPSSDTDVINGIPFRRDHVALNAQGAQGNITLLLPAGLGYRTAPRSRRLSREIVLGQLPLKATLAPAGILTATLAGDIAEETKPVWFPISDVTWTVELGTLNFSSAAAAPSYVRAAELAALEADAAQGRFFDPSMGQKPSNDGYFRAITSIIAPQISVKSDARGAAALQATIKLGPGALTTHFPHGVEIRWQSGRLDIRDDHILPATSTLFGVDAMTVPYQAGCAGCGNGTTATQRPVTGAPRDGTLTFTVDGGLDGPVDFASPVDLAWGQLAPPAAAFAHRAHAFADGRFLMAGVFLTGTSSDNAASQQAESLLLSGMGPADLAQAERPGTDTYETGAADYPGLNFRALGDAEHDAESVIAGQPSGLWPLTGRSKYYVRASGVSGIHEAVLGGFPDQLTLYGYGFHFASYGLSFRATAPQESRINGSFSVPEPSGFDQNFERLLVNCLGDVTTVEVPVAESGRKKALDYWVAEFIPLALEFQRSDDLQCQFGHGLLVMQVQAYATHVGSPLYGALGFLSSGEIVSANDVLSGAAPLNHGFDSRLSVPASFRLAGPSLDQEYSITTVGKAFFTDFDTRPADQRQPGSGADRGYVSVAGAMRLPFFNEMPVHIHTSGVETNPTAPILIMAGGSTAAWQPESDLDNRGYPLGEDAARYHDARDAHGTTLSVHRPRARQQWLHLLDFDLPLRWSSAARSFTSVDEPQTAGWMFVVRTERHCRYLSPRFADLNFGAAAEALPVFTFGQLGFEEADQTFGLTSTFTSLGWEQERQALQDGLQALEELANPMPTALFGGPLEALANPAIDRFLGELQAARRANADPALWVEARDRLVQNYFGGPTALFPQALAEMGTDVGVLQISQRLTKAAAACRAVRGILARDAARGTNRPLAQTFLRELLRHIDPTLSAAVVDLVGNALDQVVADQIGPQDAALEEIVHRLDELATEFDHLDLSSQTGGPFRREIEDVFQQRQANLNAVANQVSTEVARQLARFRDDEDPLAGQLRGQLYATLTRRTLDLLLAQPLVADVQTRIRLHVADFHEALRESFDTTAQIFSSAIRSIVSAGISKLDAKFQEMLGAVANVGALAQVNGHARFDGDSLTSIRLDGRARLQIGLTLEVDAFVEVKALTSDSPNVFCSTRGVPTVEASMGATAALTTFGKHPAPGKNDKGSVDTGSSNNGSTDGNALAATKNSITLRVKALFENSPDGTGIEPLSLLGFGGLVEIKGSIGTGGNFAAAHFAGGLGISAESTYITGMASASFLGADGEAGFFFGKICNPDAFYWDKDVQKILGNFPVEGIYGFIQVKIPTLVDLGCAFRVKAGAAMGAGFISEGMPQHQTFLAKFQISISGDLLCILSIKAEIALAFRVGEGGVAWTGRGTFSISLLFIDLEVSASLTYVNGQFSASID